MCCTQGRYCCGWGVTISGEVRYCCGYGAAVSGEVRVVGQRLLFLVFSVHHPAPPFMHEMSRNNQLTRKDKVSISFIDNSLGCLLWDVSKHSRGVLRLSNIWKARKNVRM